LKQIKIFFIILILFSLNGLFARKLELTIKYIGFNVVYVSFEDNGRELMINAKSSALASIASEMDNQYSAIYQDEYLTNTYAKIINQKDYQERRIVQYDRDKQQAHFTSFIDSTRNCLYPIHPEARDFFSALFYLSGNIDESGGTLWLDANKLIWKADYQVLGREVIRSFDGKKNTILVKLEFTKISESEKERSDMLTNNLVNEENALYIWFSDDEERLPLKAKFAMKPFSVVWKVTNYEN
jgi:uncharacterized protein DUF3108